MENIKRLNSVEEQKDKIKVRKYSVAGRLKKWSKDTGVETDVVDDTDKFFHLIREMNREFNVDGVSTYIEGNSHDEDYITEYFIFGSNDLWGETCKVKRNLYEVTNVYCYGDRGLRYAKYITNYFITFQGNHLTIAPVVQCDASVMNPTIIEPDVLVIRGVNDDAIVNLANILGLKEL